MTLIKRLPKSPELPKIAEIERQKLTAEKRRSKKAKTLPRINANKRGSGKIVKTKTYH